MLLPLALLLLHPQIAPKISVPTETAALNTPAAVSAGPASSRSLNDGEEAAAAAEATVSTAALATDEMSAALPEAPVPLDPVEAHAPAAFLNPAKQMKVSVDELIAENRRKEMMWKGLIIASSGAATFDALTTRHAISTEGAVELNPLLRPFAGNSSLFAAIQVGPALLDFAGRKMMYSRVSWVRHMWWVPQSASFVSSVFCGAHNMAFH